MYCATFDAQYANSTYAFLLETSSVLEFCFIHITHLRWQVCFPLKRNILCTTTD